MNWKNYIFSPIFPRVLRRLEIKETPLICRCNMFNEVVAKSRKSEKIKMLGNLLEARPFNEFSL